LSEQKLLDYFGNGCLKMVEFFCDDLKLCFCLIGFMIDYCG